MERRIVDGWGLIIMGVKCQELDLLGAPNIRAVICSSPSLLCTHGLLMLLPEPWESSWVPCLRRCFHSTSKVVYRGHKTGADPPAEHLPWPSKQTTYRHTYVAPPSRPRRLRGTGAEVSGKQTCALSRPCSGHRALHSSRSAFSRSGCLPRQRVHYTQSHYLYYTAAVLASP